MTWRLVPAIALLASATMTIPVRAGEGPAPITPKETKSAPRAPANASDAAAKQAVEAAVADLAALEERYAIEAEALAKRVSEETAAVLDVSDQEAALRKRLADLGSEIERAEESLLQAQIAGDQAKKRAAHNLQELKSEISSQGFALKERLKNTLIAAQHPELTKQINALEDSETFTSEERLAALLRLFDRVLEAARTVERARLTIQLGGPRGALAVCDTLRVGLVGGAYHDPATGECGLLGVTQDSRGQFGGRSERLSPEEQRGIAALIKDPERGGVLPFDVSGGAVLAVMRGGDAEQGVFARYGFVLWPLLAVALIGVFIIFAFGHRLHSTPAKAAKEVKAPRTAEVQRAQRPAQPVETGKG